MRRCQFFTSPRSCGERSPRRTPGRVRGNHLHGNQPTRGYMISADEFRAVQRRVAVLGRFNADPYNPNEWWKAGPGLRSLLYRLRVGVEDRPAENLYGLRVGSDPAARAARRQKLYAVLRPMFRERTVLAELSG